MSEFDNLYAEFVEWCEHQEEKSPGKRVVKEALLAKHIPLWAGIGFDQIIYLALTTSNTAIQKEYVHVAVDFSKSSLRNFELVAAILNNSGD